MWFLFSVLLVDDEGDMSVFLLLCRCRLTTVDNSQLV